MCISGFGFDVGWVSWRFSIEVAYWRCGYHIAIMLHTTLRMGTHGYMTCYMGRFLSRPVCEERRAFCIVHVKDLQQTIRAHALN